MKEITKEVTVYLAEDGKEFLDSSLCTKYEETELKRRQAIKYFSVVHNADTTEGRGYSQITYIAVESEYSAELYATLYCEKNFGSRIDFVQGVSPMWSWILQSITPAAFVAQQPGKLGDYPRKVNQVFLSNGKALEGLRDPLPLK